MVRLKVRSHRSGQTVQVIRDRSHRENHTGQIIRVRSGQVRGQVIQVTQFR